MTLFIALLKNQWFVIITHYYSMDLLSRLNSYVLRGKYTWSKKEAAFQKELFKHMEKDWFFCYHIEDTSYGFRFLDGLCATPWPQWYIFGLELKIIDKYTFNVSQFEDSQIALFEDFQWRGIISYIGIFSMEVNKYIVLTYEDILARQNEKGGIKLFDKIK